MNEITKQESFEDKMKARIKESIGELITDEELSKLIKKGIEDAYFQPRTYKDGYHTKTMDPLMHEVIKAELGPKVDAAVREWVKLNPEIVHKVLQDTLSAGIGKAVMQSFENMLSQSFFNFQQQIENMLINR